MTTTTPSPAENASTVDLLAIVAHRDDAELLCGGTLARTAAQGYRTGILDLTRGERGTAGDADVRGAEAEAAARVLGVVARANAGLPDAGLLNTEDSRRIVVSMIRRFRPRVVILPFPPVAIPTTGSPLNSPTTPVSSRASRSTRPTENRTGLISSCTAWPTGKTP